MSQTEVPDIRYLAPGHKSRQSSHVTYNVYDEVSFATD